MSGLRIWHLLVAVIAAAILFAVARFDALDNSYSPISPWLALYYLCALLGVWGARWRGRGARTGLYLGLLLGPIGVLIACSNPIPEGWPEPGGRRASAITPPPDPFLDDPRSRREGVESIRQSLDLVPIENQQSA